jgi:hypothetical protein
MRRRLALAACLTLALALLGAATASAHGLVGRADLPIPSWLFSWAAAIVLAVSFVALATLWPEPRLAGAKERPLLPLPAAVDVVCGAIGVFLFGVVVYSGFAGTENPTANIAPTFIFVLFWVGFVVASLLFGDVFALFNPWRATGRVTGWVTQRLLGRRALGVRPYPERLGYWPAAAGILAFAWLELAYTDKTDPSKLATLALVYAAVQLAGMTVFGEREWSARADAFGVYFRLFSRLSPFRRRDGRLWARPPLAGAPSFPVRAGAVALLCTAIGSTSFDGLSNGTTWKSISPHLADTFADLGASRAAAVQWSSTLGLAICVLLVSLFYLLGIRGMQTVGGGHRAPELAREFAHTLIPIAFAYAFAHYFSLLVTQGQATAYQISDPLGHGADLFGTGDATIDYNVVSSNTIWYVQVGALVTGHVSGLALAHDKALSIYSDAKAAVRSQYWMLVVMVGFTSLGLWLLSAVSR